MKAEFLAFLEEFVKSEYYRRIRMRNEIEIGYKKDALAEYPNSHDEMVKLQGEIQGLKFDPVQQLIEELRQEQKEKGA